MTRPIDPMTGDPVPSVWDIASALGVTVLAVAAIVVGFVLLADWSTPKSRADEAADYLPEPDSEGHTWAEDWIDERMKEARG